MHHFVAKKIFFASGGKRALTPPNQNPADVPAAASISKEEALLRQTVRRNVRVEILPTSLSNKFCDKSSTGQSNGVRELQSTNV